MTQHEYDQKKRKCFVQFCKDNGIDQEVSISIFDAFDQIFDRAYALGKQFGNSEQVNVEKAAERYADEIRIPASIPGVMVPFIKGLAHDAYLQGAQDCLGKQETKQESKQETVIQGWVARDKDGDVPLFVGEGKPYRNKYGDFISVPTLYLPRNEFPDIVSDREPIEVEIIIKRKKK